MDLTELIILDVYKQISSCVEIRKLEIKPLFLEMYKNDYDDTCRDMLFKIFAYHHDLLNRELSFFNYKITTNRNFWADDSRLLIRLIDNINELEKALLGSKYEFQLDSTYKSYLNLIRPILRESYGSTIPKNIEPIKLIKYRKIFFLVE